MSPSRLFSELETCLHSDAPQAPHTQHATHLDQLLPPSRQGSPPEFSVIISMVQAVAQTRNPAHPEPPLPPPTGDVLQVVLFLPPESPLLPGPLREHPNPSRAISVFLQFFPIAAMKTL